MIHHGNNWRKKKIIDLLPALELEILMTENAHIEYCGNGKRARDFVAENRVNA